MTCCFVSCPCDFIMNKHLSITCSFLILVYVGGVYFSVWGFASSPLNS